MIPSPLNETVRVGCWCMMCGSQMRVLKDEGEDGMYFECPVCYWLGVRPVVVVRHEREREGE